MDISFDEIKRLKELTGAGVTDAKKALVEAGGDFEKAVEAMRVKGLAKADSKSQREVRAGLVDTYVHSGRIGVVLEVNCETDFVAKTDEFKAFVHDVAMHIAASAPIYITAEDIPAAEMKKEEEIERRALLEEGKPEQAIDKIIEGKLAKFTDSIVLMRQPFIKDPNQTIEDYTKEMISKLGENIVIRRFARIELGGK